MVDIRAQGVSQVGKTVADRYMLVRVLGIGGMGSVYEALHTVTLRRVAIKLMHPWVIDAGQATAARFLREAQAAASIGHPAIVDVLDAGTLPDGSLYLVFELLEGEELETALTIGALTTADIVSISVSVLDGLSAAHKSGFIHRDIKPANIFIARNRAGEREVKVLDFGIAKRIGMGRVGNSQITAQGTIVGTLDYMSPEQAMGAQIDARADLWSVGAMMFRALAGTPPFVGENQVEVIDGIIRGQMPSLAMKRPELPRELVAVIERALERDLGRRWQSAAAMRDALLTCNVSHLRTPISAAMQLNAPTPPSDPSNGGARNGVQLPRAEPSSSGFGFEASYTGMSTSPGEHESTEVEFIDENLATPSSDDALRALDSGDLQAVTEGPRTTDRQVVPLIAIEDDDEAAPAEASPAETPADDLRPLQLVPGEVDKTPLSSEELFAVPAPSTGDFQAAHTHPNDPEFSEEATATAVELSNVLGAEAFPPPSQPSHPGLVAARRPTGPDFVVAHPSRAPSVPDFDKSRLEMLEFEDTRPPPQGRPVLAPRGMSIPRGPSLARSPLPVSLPARSVQFQPSASEPDRPVKKPSGTMTMLLIAGIGLALFFLVLLALR